MKVNEILTDLVSSSWLSFCEAILDNDYGYLISLNPTNFNIVRDSNDTAIITVVGDTLPGVTYTRYETINYAPLLFFLNNTIEHPLYLPPNIEIWLPHPNKIYNLLRDLNITQ